MKNNQLAFYLFTFSVFLFAISPNLLSDGMFMDGLLYADISKNLGNGIGDLWNLSISKVLHPSFHEHPPLAFGIQGIFFRIFGDSYLIERIYSFFTFILTAFLIIKIWKLIAPKHTQLAWLPILFWFTIPLITWAAPNNMLENTLMIFTTLAVYYILRNRESNQSLFLIISGILLLLGVLTKGLVALFPLSLPFFIYLFDKNYSFLSFIKNTSILLITLLTSFALLIIIIPESYNSLYVYFNQQIVGSLQNKQTVDSRFFIVIRLFKELIPVLILSLIIILSSRKKINQKLPFDKWFYILIALGLSGVLPIMVSMKQSGFYMLATFPFFALGFAYLLKERVIPIFEKFKNSFYFKVISSILLITAISLNLLQIGKIGRDKELLIAVHDITRIVPPEITIGIPEELREKWSLHGYFYRYANISLDPRKSFEHDYYFCRKGSNTAPPNNYELVKSYENAYDFYKKIKPTSD